MAALRGMSDMNYVSQTTWRQFKVHVSAYYKDKYAVVSTVSQMLGGNMENKKSDKPVTANQPNRRPFSWFKRKPGFKYQFIDLDGPLGPIKAAAGSFRDAQAKKRMAFGQYGAPMSLMRSGIPFA